MPRRSTIARMQQAVVFALLATVAVWVVWQGPQSPLAAIAGALGIAFGYSFFLAVELLLLRLVGVGEGVPQPTASQLIRAWWGETCMAARVFYWRQPFRWRAEPDFLDAAPGRRGLVFIHGFICNRGFWQPWLARTQGRAFVALNLEPAFGLIDDYAGLVEDAVAQVTQASGMPPVLVCHSMGGLAARAWLRRFPDASRVHRIITIGSPHHGTWLGRFSHTPNGRQMRIDSEWLQELFRDEGGRSLPPFTCWYSHCDNIVFPTSSATLPHADNRLVRGPAHVELAFVPEVMERSLALADSP